MSREIDFRIGDPVMDAAQGRPMVVVDVPEQTVAEWSDANNYNLRENYGHAKFDPDPQEPVVVCVYVSNVGSEPSKTYTFPASRVRLLDVHHADGGRRLYDRVAVEVLNRVFLSLADEGNRGNDEAAWVKKRLPRSEFGDEIVSEAWELADVERTIGGDE